MPDSLTEPFKFSTGKTQGLHVDGFRSRRLLELSVLCRIVELESPKLASDSGLGPAYRRLKAAKHARVSRSPDLLRWLNVTRHMVTRNMHQSLPLGHIQDHLLDLGRLAIDATCQESGSYQCTVRLQENGTITLPSLRLQFSPGREHAGKLVHLQTEGGKLEATVDGRRFSVALENLEFANNRDGTAWIVRPRLGWGILLEDSHEMFRAHHTNNPKWKMRDLDTDYIQAWISRSDEACRLLSIIEHDLWVPVRDILFSVIPLQSSPEVNLSGTCADVLGCICSSLPLNPGLLAETMVHESAHTLLHMLSDDFSYWVLRGEGLPYHSPWRKDLRPISGMMHGIFAFLGVGAFWACLLQTDPMGEFQKLGRLRLRAVALQVRQAITEITDSPELNGDGRELSKAAADKLDELDAISRVYAPEADEENNVREIMGRHRKSLPAVDRQSNPASPPALERLWSTEFEVRMPPPLNLAAHDKVQIQNVSDIVHLASAANDDCLRRWEPLIKRTRISEPQSAALVQGSILYGKGDFEGAIDCYRHYVQLRPDDLDAWSLLCSALRRAGRPLDARAITFDVHRLRVDEMRQQWGDRWPFYLHRQIAAAGTKESYER